MRQSGDEKKGYTIEKKGRVLLLKVWGMWDDELADKYKVDMLASYPEMQGESWYVVADISKFPPQREYTQNIHGWLMGEAVKAGMLKAASVVESSLTKMQIGRIAKESGMPELAFHTDVDGAVRWVQS
jgi:hypothetical protein